MKSRRMTVPVLVGLVASIVAFAAYAGMAAGASKAKYNVYLSYYNSSPYGIAQKNGAEQQAKASGVSITSATPNNDPHLQQTQLQDAITTGKYQGMIIAALDGHGLAPTIKQAVAKGIKVIVVDYTLGTLNQTKILRPTPGLISTVGQGLREQITGWGRQPEGGLRGQGRQGQAVLGRGHVRPGQLPDRRLPDRRAEDDVRDGADQAAVHAARDLRPGDGAEGDARLLPDEAEGRRVRDVRRPDERRRRRRLQAARAQAGQGLPRGRLRQYEAGRRVDQVRPLVRRGGVLPDAISKVSVKTLVDALNGKKVPTTINILHQPGTPLIIDQAFLKTHPNFKADWSL